MTPLQEVILVIDGACLVALAVQVWRTNRKLTALKRRLSLMEPVRWPEVEYRGRDLFERQGTLAGRHVFDPTSFDDDYGAPVPPRHTPKWSG